MKRTFIYTDDKSNKFWTIEIADSSYTVNYGKVGTAGQTQTKEFDDESACKKAVDKLIAEKTKKGYVEQPEGFEPPKPEKSELKIPKYKGHDSAEVEDNEFVVNPKKPLTILSAFAYQMKNFDEFFYTIQNMPAEECLKYGVIDDDEYIELVEACEDDDLGDYNEVILTNILAQHPEMFPFIEEYIKKVVIESSCRDLVSGPFVERGFLFGEALIPMLANADAKYFYLLEEYVNTNVEVKYDDEL